MRKATMFILALLFALATMGMVADDVFARGGGGSGSSSGGGPAGGPGVSGGSGDSGVGAVSSGAVGGDPDAPRTDIETGVLALPRFGTVVTGCTTTNFGAQGGVAPCPVNR